MKRFISCFLTTLLLSFTFMGVAFAREISVYRVYDSKTGEHLYTTDTNEVTTLVQNGWDDEKTAWVSPSAGTGVIRLFNPASGQHLYTTDQNEIAILTSGANGWQVDNNGQPLFHSGGDIPIYRLYSPVTGDHHLTTDVNEYEVLGSGPDWNQEDVAFYADQYGNGSSGYGIDPYANVPKHETLNMVVLNPKIADASVNTTNQTFDVYFTPEGSNEQSFLGPIVSTEYVGTDYSGIQIGNFRAGTYTIQFKGPNNVEYSGGISLTQADFGTSEQIQQPSGVINLLYREVTLNPSR